MANPGQIYRIYGVTFGADSGFRVPFYRYVEYTSGWYWVGRIRNRDFIRWQNTTDSWFKRRRCIRKPPKSTDLGTLQWVRRCQLAAFPVLVPQPKPTQERVAAIQPIGSAEPVMLQ